MPTKPPNKVREEWIEEYPILLEASTCLEAEWEMAASKLLRMSPAAFFLAVSLFENFSPFFVPGLEAGALSSSRRSPGTLKGRSDMASDLTVQRGSKARRTFKTYGGVVVTYASTKQKMKC